ncbi:hypothetical protein QBC45DRAFT_424878 [Copromyces sp. CBS 386.78]|nr:hypothetical protein QBC45DRAFT_424878 [Copromyces sp. CBS 386.78]
MPSCGRSEDSTGLKTDAAMKHHFKRSQDTLCATKLRAGQVLCSVTVFIVLGLVYPGNLDDGITRWAGQVVVCCLGVVAVLLLLLLLL